MKNRKVIALLLVGVFLLGGCGMQGNFNKDTQSSGEVKETEQDSEAITESESEPEPEPEPEPVVSTFTLTATGDCALGILQYHGYEASFHQYYVENGASYFFDKFSETFSNDDLTLINLECVFTDETERVEKTYNIKGPKEYATILSSHSIEAATLGNNHSMDYGPKSLTDTQEALDEAGVIWAYNDIVSYYFTDDGIKVAIVSVNLFKGEELAENYLFDGIAKAKTEGANLIIVCPHWGIEGDYYANAQQQDLGHRLIDAGADLIIGNHPHVLQGIEYYNGKMICYSLANFSFGANRNPAEKNTAVYQQTFTFVDGVLQANIDASIIPARVSGASGYNNFQPIIAEGEQKADIIQKMNEYSNAINGVSFDENGKIIINE
ncbi:MAG: CapA family protein [Lachnospiraceae bacterium]|nr:CapA family protein [Lachnospiraceae bacterium]